MAAGELSTSEVAFAAINAVDKLQYVLHLRSLAGGAAGGAASTVDPLVAAELALYAGQAEVAEAKLLQVRSGSAQYKLLQGVCVAAPGLRRGQCESFKPRLKDDTLCPIQWCLVWSTV